MYAQSVHNGLEVMQVKGGASRVYGFTILVFL